MTQHLGARLIPVKGSRWRTSRACCSSSDAARSLSEGHERVPWVKQGEALLQGPSRGVLQGSDISSEI